MLKVEPWKNREGETVEKEKKWGRETGAVFICLIELNSNLTRYSVSHPSWPKGEFSSQMFPKYMKSWWCENGPPSGHWQRAFLFFGAKGSNCPAKEIKFSLFV